ncbi:MAG TPA: LTA synthase family protein [Prolixibacteraceae bacterium]|nr:LTA synthase family protein [Prolixibacteraceae bacterium]
MASSSIVARKLRVSNRRFLSMSLILGAFLLLVRLYDMLVVAPMAGYPHGSWESQVYGIGYDFLLWLKVSLWLMIPIIAIGYYSRLWQKIVFISIAVMIVLFDLALVEYFSVARIPLGADVFAYSKEEMMHTLNASGQMSLSTVLPSVIFSILVVNTLAFVKTITLGNGLRRTLTTLIFLSVFLGSFTNPYPQDYRNEFQMYVASNKLSFFTESVDNYRDRKAHLEADMNEPITLQDNGTFDYLNADFPLLHTENTPDALGPYFNPGATPPSFIFVMVESLGRAYSGEGAYLGSFTPYLDSLAQKSLYWENNLSTSGRTFQVLPSVLGSLPFGEHGFSDLEKMPDHLTMISLLKKQAGYRSSFYYGGEASFDNMEAFMAFQGVDRVMDQGDFEEAYKRMPANGNGFSWGYGDHEIFRKYVDDLQPGDSLPRIDVMLTLAIHDPFILPDQQAYNKKVLQRMEELALEDKQKSFNRKYIKQLASVMYFDDALRGFINRMSRLKSFENTILVITGDHRMPEIPISSQIDRFHVPLVIYSPLLKKAEKFSSVVSHFDITPSLLSFLKHNYGIRQPLVSAWIGHGLDTETSFRSVRSYPLMRNKNEFMDFVDGTNFLAGETVYSLYENMGSEPQPVDGAVMKELQNKFNAFRKANLYVTRNNKLIPDSIKIR